MLFTDVPITFHPLCSVTLDDVPLVGSVEPLSNVNVIILLSTTEYNHTPVFGVIISLIICV